MSPPPDPARVRRLLVRANNWIGDVVLASPALRALRRRFPQARLSVLARPHVLPALEGSPDLDEVLLYEHRGRHAGLAGRLRLASELRARRFDLAVLFQKAIEAALLARAAAIPRRFGYATDRRGWLLTDPIPETVATRRLHHARVFLDLAAAAGAQADDPRPCFPLGAADRDAAGRLLAEEGLRPEEPIVSVHPGASKPPRAWHPERFGLLAAEMARLIGGRVVVFGSSSDGPLCRRVVEAAGPPALSLAGRTSVRQMAAVFERSRLFLGSDSGPMHIAAAVGAPVFAVFGPGDPGKTAPFMEPSRYEILTRQFPCSPCRQAFFRECDPAPSGKPWCLEEATVEEALARVRALLSRTSGAATAAR